MAKERCLETERGEQSGFLSNKSPEEDEGAEATQGRSLGKVWTQTAGLLGGIWLWVEEERRRKLAYL